MNVPPAAKITMLLRDASETEKRRLDAYNLLIRTLARLEKAELSSSPDDAKGAAQRVFQTTTVLLPLAGVIDKAKESERLNKEKAKLEKEIASLSGRLSNEGFVAKAPANVVEEQKARLAEAQEAVLKISEALKRLQDL